MGTRVAQALAALDYPVAGWSRSGKVPAGVQGFAGVERLPAFLARTRVLINTLPLTDETRDILRRDTLQHLLPDRKTVVEGKSVSGRVNLGGRRNLKKTKEYVS